jgi:hypothetical protein
LVPADRLFLGDLRETLAAAYGRIGEKAALAHCDLGSGRSESDGAFARWLGSAIPIVVAPQGIVVSDQLLRGDSLQEIALPPNVPPDRYHLYEVRPG